MNFSKFSQLTYKEVVKFEVLKVVTMKITCHLECEAVLSDIYLPVFWMNIFTPSTWQKSSRTCGTDTDTRGP